MDTRKCDNCDTACGPDDVFCENCGYDFITGSLPSDGPGPSPVPTGVGGAPGEVDPDRPDAAAPDALPGTSPDAVTGADGEAEEVSPPPPSLLDADAGGGGLDVPRLRLAVSVDRAYFDEVVSDGEIDFPDPVPADTELELLGEELHIGRTSESRAIHPDIDVAELTGDQAVSSRHAVFRVEDDGGCTIVDVGSTNGTFIDAVDSEAIAQGLAIEVKPGTAVYLGAWTRLTILD